LGSVADPTHPSRALATFEAAGYVLETSPGFVYTTQAYGSIPLYGLFNAGGNDHFYTSEIELHFIKADNLSLTLTSASLSERNSALSNGYTDQGITAYVPLPGIINHNNLC
jgi:hypothetical protein